ncbi:MAG: hypothetical protein MI864_10710 [Pseudomonadales bacterium]|nr:hypothetical protein [Pseudomonadales bacterium]
MFSRLDFSLSTVVFSLLVFVSCPGCQLIPLGQTAFHETVAFLWQKRANLGVDTYQIRSVDSSYFPHRLVLKSGQGSHIHVYLEGDGKAWLNRKTYAMTPTVPNPVLLEIMLNDPAPAIYLGRPCYFLDEYPVQDSRCSPYWWTFGRFHPDVVSSVKEVLLQLNPEQKEMTLIGHSGGATLAALLAHQLPNIERVITFAGNLDTDRWTRYHGYAPLTGSTNPFGLGSLPDKIAHYHFVAMEDREILPRWIADYAEMQSRATLIPLDDTEHQCCWPTNWWALMNNAKTRDGSQGIPHDW